jgi:hypothetical protein
MGKYRLRVSSDMGSDTVNEKIRQALHKRQANLMTSSPRERDRYDYMLTEMEAEIPGMDDLEAFTSWTIASLREGFTGTAIVSIEALPEDTEIVYTAWGVE